MKWPWRRARTSGTLAIGGDAEVLLWAHVDGDPGQPGGVFSCGRLPRSGDGTSDFARRLRACAAPGAQALAVLPLQQSQLLLIEAPSVAPEELRAASRWRIKGLVEGSLDEYTIDVLPVGDDRSRPQRQLFVAAARNDVLRERAELAQAAGWALRVIDIGETAQRNLQCAVVARAGLQARATAALLRHGTECLLTICAAGELFYARRLDAALLAPAHHSPAVAAAMAIHAARVPEVWDIVDYGAEPEYDDNVPDPVAQDGNERLLLELQRSFDVWERSWPELPLAGLWLQLGAGTDATAASLRRTLGLRVERLDAEAVLPGFDAAVGDDDELRDALLPVIGVLLRSESRPL